VSDNFNLRDDLVGEQMALDTLVHELSDAQWHTMTPSPGWNVADQIGHLAYFDAAAALSISDPESYLESVKQMSRRSKDENPENFTLEEFRAMTPAQVLERWRANRISLNDAAASLDDRTRVDWYGRPMSGRSFLTARLMETWAHGTDVADTIGQKLPATNRLRHIAHLGFITREWSYRVRGEEPPTGQVQLLLTSPGGDVWAFGSSDSDEVIRGPAEDFCLVVTQRRHVDDTQLEVGPLGREWLLRAQAFAGPPTSGPVPSSITQNE
jgi:uncharacterized protein (TIGR03084 family)